MKRAVSLFLITLVSCFLVTAQTARTRLPDLPSDIAAAVGQDSLDLLNNPSIRSRMKRLLGKRYDSFMESFETVNPVVRRGNLLFSSGCLIHACTHLESAIAVDLGSKTIHLAIFRQDERTKFFNEGGTATPKVIREWANNLKQINTGASDSQSTRAFAAPASAERSFERSRLRRLHNLTTVRGFIGGESHDSYVIHARKGQTLTMRLSWKDEGDNRASLSVSESPDFNSVANFGTEHEDGRLWSGRAPRTGDYYVYVVAHPSARYKLKVKVR